MTPPAAKQSVKSLIDLPSDLIDDILGRLPIGEAVRTSVLSGAWRRRWRSIPDLHLDTGNGDYLQVADVVEYVLLHHSVPIRSLSLSFKFLRDPAVLHQYHVDHSNDHMDRWLAALSSSTLRSLTLRFGGFWYVNLGSTLSSFRNLTHIKLYNCLLPPPPSPTSTLGFPYLQSLHLERCYFPKKENCSSSSISDFISNYPLLQELVLVDMEQAGREEYFNIRSPRLRSLVFRGEFLEFSLVSTPLLTMAYIGLQGITRCSYSDDKRDVELYQQAVVKCSFVEAFGRATSIEMLDLCHRSLHFLGGGGGGGRMPQVVPNCFESLKALTLAVKFDSSEEASTVLCLMRSSPNLQELELIGYKFNKRYMYRCGLGYSFWREQNHLELSKLQTLKLTCIECAPSEIEFVDFVLPKAQGLQKMVINVHHFRVKDRGIDESKAKELMECWRASTRAEIIHTGAVFFLHRRLYGLHFF